MSTGKNASDPSARRARQWQQVPKRKTPSAPVAIIALAVVILVGGVIVISAMQSSARSTAVGGLVTDVSTKGPADAKVTIVEYSDYQCPWCKRFADTTGRQIDQTYVATGKVRFIYRNMVIIGETESLWAAEAALCAGEQGRFWDYHDKIFASQAGENQGAFVKSRLKVFAKDLGLDSAAFSSCLDDDRYADQVHRETAEAKQRGVKSTPTFFVNGLKLEGALPFSEFQSAIEAELRRQ